MNDVPQRSLSIVAASPGISVTEAIEHAVPNGLERGDQQAFTQRNPYVIHDQVSDPEVFYQPTPLNRATSDQTSDFFNSLPGQQEEKDRLLPKVNQSK